MDDDVITFFNSQLGLERFLAMIGDYESLIILQPYAPQLSPAMNVNSLILYVDFKTYDKGTFFKNHYLEN